MSINIDACIVPVQTQGFVKVVRVYGLEYVFCVSNKENALSFTPEQSRAHSYFFFSFFNAVYDK